MTKKNGTRLFPGKRRPLVIVPGQQGFDAAQDFLRQKSFGGAW
ncbi:MAG: hypothetical protein R3F31_03165 [Verrucomicrobiales bacterium]